MLKSYNLIEHHDEMKTDKLTGDIIYDNTQHIILLTCVYTCENMSCLEPQLHIHQQ